jgi:hypothetical protein
LETSGKAAKSLMMTVVYYATFMSFLCLCRNMDPKMGQGIKKAGELGAAGGDCEAIYRCKEKARHYRFPGKKKVIL